MARKRNSENKGLPTRWKFQHGAYYYRVPPGLEPQWDGKQMFHLGKTLPEAYRAWAERLGGMEIAGSIGQLLDRYLLEVVPKKSPTTQAGNLVFIKTLRTTFGEFKLNEIKPRHVYQYVDKRSAKVSAHREIEVLSHALTKAVQWGYIDRHPFKGEVILEGEVPRSRYVEDWEIVEALLLTPTRKTGSVRMVHAYMKLKILTGMRRSDLLQITMADLQDDGIHYTPSKTKKSTGKKLIISWSPELRAVVDEAKAARPVLSPYLFCNRRGECYRKEDGSAHGWDSIWQRFMDRLLEDTNIKERFTEHDLRAKCASDADSLEHASALLAHTDIRTTKRIYRRKAERVKPLR